MKDGKWLEPRHTSKEIFDKDYPQLDFSGGEVRCPGCRSGVALNRKNAAMRRAGWCKACNRAVTL